MVCMARLLSIKKTHRGSVSTVSPVKVCKVNVRRVLAVILNSLSLQLSTK